eukprot:gb/GECH01011514.1/.p1 GENE.gb/GECH01011514.1/~~gb/GECH01011514.1/.p1  ORF type:complete len:548 (+),score=133.81 gb/GECH01011514.1/:1-1644(+)
MINLSKFPLFTTFIIIPILVTTLCCSCIAEAQDSNSDSLNPLFHDLSNSTQQILGVLDVIENKVNASSRWEPAQSLEQQMNQIQSGYSQVAQEYQNAKVKYESLKSRLNDVENYNSHFDAEIELINHLKDVVRQLNSSETIPQEQQDRIIEILNHMEQKVKDAKSDVEQRKETAKQELENLESEKAEEENMLQVAEKAYRDEVKETHQAVQNEKEIIARLRNIVFKIKTKQFRELGETCDEIYGCQGDLKCEQGLCRSPLDGVCERTEDCTQNLECLDNTCSSFERSEFTTCGNSGRFGPSQEQCDNSYRGTSFENKISVSSGYQYWEAPFTTNFRITCFGAAGGGPDNPPGAKMSGTVRLEQGEKLKILVGQQGGYHDAGGGGGGTFVTDDSNNPIMIAAGGSGQQETHGISSYSYGQISRDAADSPHEQGGTNGHGGNGDSDGSSGGGGLKSDGSGGQYGTPGKAFVNGGTGGKGTTEPDAYGGFGGGAGTHGNTGGGGGGGGYSGGSGADHKNGSGGGSYNSGSNQDNKRGVNHGHGRVIINVV